MYLSCIVICWLKGGVVGIFLFKGDLYVLLGMWLLSGNVFICGVFFRLVSCLLIKLIVICWSCLFLYIFVCICVMDNKLVRK